MSAQRFAVTTTRDRGGCTDGPTTAQEQTTAIPRDDADHGQRALGRVLAAAPWRLGEQAVARPPPAPAPAAHPPGADETARDAAFAALTNGEPWGAVQVVADPDQTYADFIATVMTARERTPGACDDERRREGCLFPSFELGMRPGATL